MPDPGAASTDFPGADFPPVAPAANRNDLTTGLLVFLAYATTAALGLSWATVAGAASPVWPAAGVAVAALSIAGLRFWPGIALGLFTASQLTGATHSIVSQLAIGLGNAGAAVIGAILLTRLTEQARPSLARLRAVGALIGAGTAAAAFAALVGALALIAGGKIDQGQLPEVAITWFLGDLTGILVFASLILALGQVRRSEWSTAEGLHLVAILAAAAAVAAMIFFGPDSARTFYIYPVLMWAALMLRPAGATAALAIVATIAIAGTTLNHGPFATVGTADYSLLQQFLVLSALIVLALAAVGEERRTDALRRTGAAEALAASRLAELTSLYESSPIGLAFLDREYRYLRINPELARANGLPVSDHIGRTIREVIPANAEAIEPVIDAVFATGKPVGDFEVSAHSPASPGSERHWLAGFYPVFDDADQVEAVGAWVLDITERKAAEQRETLLAREVDHRAKNLLAVVQSIVQLTPGEDGPELKTSVVGRIQALARAHSLLSDARWEGVALGDLVRDELAPFAGAGSTRVSCKGPSLTLRPPAAQSLALVLHELATNAAKYGALSNDSGRIAVEWRRAEDEAGPFVGLEWVESGGPPVDEPSELGFGSSIIRASVQRQLRGKVLKEWLPEGLHCTLRIPAAEIASKMEG